MVLAYFDIETYSPAEEPKFSDKTILLYYEEKVGGDTTLMLREWEIGEELVLRKFYDPLKKKLKSKKVTLLGWNIIRFEAPFLTYRLFFHQIDNLYNILEVFRKTYWRDLRQSLLPFNKFRFKGLSMENVAEKLRITPPKYSNKEIKTFYEKKEYKKIEEHLMSEMKFLSDLSWRMRDPKEVSKAFGTI